MNTRSLQPGDDREIERIFLETIALGRPLPFACPGIESYMDLCLSWYLGPGRDDASVLEDCGQVVGYVLVCRDGRAHRQWTRAAGSAWVLRTVRSVLGGRLPADADCFHRLRLRDGWEGLVGPPPPCPAHLHLNIQAGHRGGSSGRRLLEAGEARFRAAGIQQWYGEVNAPVGRRAGALVRHRGRVVARRPSHTFSWLAGRPIEQLRVTRAVPAEPQIPLPRRATPPADPAGSAVSVGVGEVDPGEPEAGGVDLGGRG